jgi:5'-methylthioadenosine phosphorylase
MRIGIIGGSGLDNPDILKDGKDVEVDTPWGKPSSPLKMGFIDGVPVVLLARHGRHHEIPPTQVNFRANVAALKQQGCTHILATSAVGILRSEIKRGDLVILDQFIDFTRHRHITFHESFKDGIKHTAMAEPFSPELRNSLVASCKTLGLSHHAKGCVITIEGPRFSTIAESRLWRSWGADVVNMSIAPEAILANEAGIPYAAVAMGTDYDSWKEDEHVSWDEIVKVFGQNAEKVTRLLVATIPRVHEKPVIRETHPAPRQSDTERIKSKIRTVPHWPKPGVMFRDVTTLLKDAEGLGMTMDLLMQRYKTMPIDVVAGIEARGFIIGSILAHRLGVGFVPMRKKGKLPAATMRQEYSLEYGTDTIEVHRDAIAPNSRVLVVDDLLATGGTSLAACNLVKRLGAIVVECCFIIDLPDLGGSKKLRDAGYNVFSLVQFEGD